MQKSTKIFSNSPNSSKELNVILRAPLHFPHQLKTRAEFRSVTELVIQKRTRLARTPTVTDLHSSLSLSLFLFRSRLHSFPPSCGSVGAEILLSEDSNAATAKLRGGTHGLWISVLLSSPSKSGY